MFNLSSSSFHLSVYYLSYLTFPLIIQALYLWEELHDPFTLASADTKQSWDSGTDTHGGCFQ